MYKARIKIKDVTFKGPGQLAFGGVPDIDATMYDLLDLSPVPRPDGKRVFDLVPPDGKNQTLKIYIPAPSHTGDKGPYKNGVRVVFQLPASSGFTMLGLAFAKEQNDHAHVGENEFPQIILNRDDDASELEIVDMTDQTQRVSYTYGILMQEFATGNVGIFDPSIENEVPDSGPGV